MRQFSAAGVSFTVHGQFHIPKAFRPFLTANGGASFAVHMHAGALPEIPKQAFLKDNVQWLHETDNSLHVWLSPGNGEKPVGYMHCDTTGKCIDIWRRPFSIHTDFVLQALLGIVFRETLAYHNGVMLHASAVQTRYGTLLFVGPSGMGKSTQAALWEKYHQATIINPDRPAITLQEGKAFVHGLPWSGSQPVYIHSSSPLRAIVFLSQGASSQAVHCSGDEKMHHLLKRAFLPYLQEAAVDACITTLERIASCTPAVQLDCLPDISAVAALEAWLLSPEGSLP